MKNIMSTIYEDMRYFKDCLVLFLNGIFRSNTEIKKFKNKYKGERCFIIATGPSLRLEDLDALKGEYTFGVNSCFRSFNQTSWRPFCYCITDQRFIDDMGKELTEASGEIGLSITFKGVGWKKENIIRLFGSKKYQNLPTHGMLRRFLDWKNTDYLSKDISKGIISGHTVIFSVLQIAEYMGFSEIYLVGVDCNYKGKQQYSDITKHTHRNSENAGDLMIIDYMYAKKHFDKSDSKVKNATRGGMLEVFERADLDRLMEETSVD